MNLWNYRINPWVYWKIQREGGENLVVDRWKVFTHDQLTRYHLVRIENHSDNVEAVDRLQISTRTKGTTLGDEK